MNNLKKILLMFPFILTLSACGQECPVPEKSESGNMGNYRLSANFFTYNNEKVVVGYSNIPWDVFKNPHMLSGVTKTYWQITENKENQILMVGVADPSVASLYVSNNGFMKAVSSKKNIIEELLKNGMVDDCFKNYQELNGNGN